MKLANKYLYLTSALAIVCGAWVLNIGLKRALPVISPDTNKSATSLSPLEWSESRKQEAINQAKTGDRKNIDALIESMIDGSAAPVNSASPHMYSTNAKLLEPPFIKKHHLETQAEFDQAIDQAAAGDKDYMYGLMIWYNKRGDLESARKWEKKIDETDSEKERLRQEAKMPGR